MRPAILILSFKRIVFSIVLLCCYTIHVSQNITVDFEGQVSNENVILSESIVQVLQDGKLLTSFKTDQYGMPIRLIQSSQLSELMWTYSNIMKELTIPYLMSQSINFITTSGKEILNTIKSC
ncbi:MAG: hypothetical protein HY062_09165 [Bacteroidetes bacterium]|nr:hypothetical protein [Bacteroidota bacterium]